MPNPYHFRSVVNGLWRIANDPYPGSLRDLDALTREQRAIGTPGYAAAQEMLRAVDAYEYARHLLRDLYDRAEPTVSTQTDVAPAQAGAALQEEEPSEEDGDPL